MTEAEAVAHAPPSTPSWCSVPNLSFCLGHNILVGVGGHILEIDSDLQPPR